MAVVAVTSWAAVHAPRCKRDPELAHCVHLQSVALSEKHIIGHDLGHKAQHRLMLDVFFILGS